MLGLLSFNSEVLMISHQYQCVFIHIPKTAGTSIERKLGHFDADGPDGYIPRNVQDHRPLRRLEPVSLGALSSAILRNLGSASALRRVITRYRSRELSRRQFDSYYKFSIVRNPWSRALSWYKNVMRDNVIKAKLKMEEGRSFKEFMQLYGGMWALKPQLDWLRNARGQVAMDFIGRFETLEQDFSTICDAIGVTDKTLPRLVISDKADSEEHFDTVTIDLVYKKYKEEIKMFGYEFEG